MSLPPSGWSDISAPSAPGGWRTWARPVVLDLLEGAWSTVIAAVGLALGVGLVDDIRFVEGSSLRLLAATAAVLVLDALLNPVLRRLASLGSAVLALLLGVIAQVALLTVVLLGVPGLTTSGWLPSVKVLLIAGAVMTAGRWIIGATDSGYVVGWALARTRRERTWTRRGRLTPAARSRAPRGMLVVQLDGVSPHVLRRAIDAGQAPNLSRWLVSGSHTVDTWWSTVPSTTPASMAGMLHADDRHVPAFRWWDRREERLLAASRPGDSALVEERFGRGMGLLRDGGVAVSTTYSGEADESYLVISKATSSRGLGPGASYVSFFSRPFVLPGALVLTLGEMVKEVYQGHRQRVRRVEPRIGRQGAYVALRGVTNVLLRKLNLSLVAEKMAGGAPIIFVDLVDYDEIAHHAGPERPEAMRALEGLDAVLGHLRHVAQAVDTDYELVVLSDHGQSLGATFAQVNSVSLADRITGLMDDTVVAVEQSSGEEFGPLNTLIASVIGSPKRRSDRLLVGPDRRQAKARREDVPELAVTGGGNLGMVWFPGLSERPDLADIMGRWPRIVPGLLSTPGIGLVATHGPQGEPVVFGPEGAVHLSSGRVDGHSPLVAFPERAAADLVRLLSLPDCGDLVVISTVDEWGLIHAFENQVGSHGGLGGRQNEALLVHPSNWPLDPDLLEDVEGRPALVGPVAVHHQLLRWRRGIGAGPAEPIEGAN